VLQVFGGSQCAHPVIRDPVAEVQLAQFAQRRVGRNRFRSAVTQGQILQ
jgi:hypothetical protein